MRLLRSPWLDTFQQIFGSAQHYAMVASPFISREGLALLTERLDPGRIRIEILTNLSPTHLLEGSTDPAALAAFWQRVGEGALYHLPGLHAKVYVADDTYAVATSGNLTRGGLIGNYEYGILLDDSTAVRVVAQDLQEYARLGVRLTLSDIEELARITSDLRQRHARMLGSATRMLREEFANRLARTQETLRELRASPGETTNAIFSRTILYLIRRQPLSTSEMHPLIQEIHPDLCDDSVDRVIRGVRFGKRWKHMVRNAQQWLKRQGLIVYRQGRWQVPESPE